MLKKILIAVVVLLAVLAGVIATRPDSYTVVRSGTVQAPAPVVFAQLRDFHQFERWSPWSELDPQMKTTFEGTAGEVGSSYAWKGNDKVGAGKMTIVSMEPEREVRIKLEFLEPFPSTNEIVWSQAPAGADAQTVTWTMNGHNNFTGKAFSLVMDMDKMIGPDFERGLTRLQTVAEAEAKKAPPAAPPAPAPEVLPAAAVAPAGDPQP